MCAQGMCRCWLKERRLGAKKKVVIRVRASRAELSSTICAEWVGCASGGWNSDTY